MSSGERDGRERQMNKHVYMLCVHMHTVTTNVDRKSSAVVWKGVPDLLKVENITLSSHLLLVSSAVQWMG